MPISEETTGMIVAGLVAIALIGGIGYVVHQDRKSVIERKQRKQIQKEYEIKYRKLLTLHADTNFDREISEEEKKAFNKKMYAENNITIIDGKLIQNNTGLELTIEDRIKILEKYQN